MKLNLSTYLSIKICVTIIFSATIILFTANLAFSYTASNGNIKLDTDILGKKSISPSKNNDNQIIYDPKSSASLTISDINVIFGTVIPGEPLKRTITLSIKNRSKFAINVLTGENSPLKDLKTKAIIPDTTCDDGICKELLASAWTSPLVYGYGMRCENIKGYSCIEGFEDEYYRQFANIKANEAFQPIIMVAKNSNFSARIVYKLNIAPTQTKGNYQNITTFILTPSF